MNRSVLHGVNGVAVLKPAGESKQELIDVQTVMNKLKNVTSGEGDSRFHLVPVVNEHHIILDEKDSEILFPGLIIILVLVMDTYNSTTHLQSPPLLMDFRGLYKLYKYTKH